VQFYKLEGEASAAASFDRDPQNSYWIKEQYDHIADNIKEE
jgi:hypothetical protein